MPRHETETAPPPRPATPATWTPSCTSMESPAAGTIRATTWLDTAERLWACKGTFNYNVKCGSFLVDFLQLSVTIPIDAMLCTIIAQGKDTNTFKLLILLEAQGQLEAGGNQNNSKLLFFQNFCSCNITLQHWLRHVACQASGGVSILKICPMSQC